jgi:methylase of polypeptide subunit release factors
MIPAASSHLDPFGWILFEVGIYQAPDVLRLFEGAGCYDSLFTTLDTGGIERVVGARKILSLLSK